MDFAAENAAHRKRLAQILRYIASMHQILSNGADNGHSFVKETPPKEDFFVSRESDDINGVLFCTNDFRQLLSIDRSREKPLFSLAPFAFYAASTSYSDKNRKRSFAGAFKSTFSFSSSSQPEKACWLRLTRLTSAQVPDKPEIPSYEALQTFLEDWKKQARYRTIDDLFTLENLQKTPKLPPTLPQKDATLIKRFLQRYNVYLQKKTYHTTLEPIYNSLFEWIQLQQDHNQELVWGLGHAHLHSQRQFISGPLLEVLVEVELSPDGALLVRPREHTGVTLNRQVVTAVANMNDSHGVLAQMHRTVAEMDTSLLSPGQPETYIPFLKRMAVELSPGGSYQASSKSTRSNQLFVSEAWCLFARPKPSSVWARDATAFADKLMLKENLQLPEATWSYTHGPNVFESVIERSRQPPTSSGLMSWFYRSSTTEANTGKKSRPLFPLPTSDAQNRVAELLIGDNYPAVVVEGPPGTGKTHTIANIMCAYLCQGKRVLATSKNAPALSVLRERLPESVRELCVDVSTSELTGMHQLQQTVERLANRVSCANVTVESEKCELLKRNIDDLEKQLQTIDEKITGLSDSIRTLLHQPDGENLLQLSRSLFDAGPWLLKVIPRWSLKDLVVLADRVSKLVVPSSDPLLKVTGLPSSTSVALIAMARSKAGRALSSFYIATREAIASVPVVGPVSGIGAHLENVLGELNAVEVDGGKPNTPEEWSIVAKALEHTRQVSLFKEGRWNQLMYAEGWPDRNFMSQESVCEVEFLLDQAVRFKKLALKLKVCEEVAAMVECQGLGAQRSRLARQIQHLAEELVDATVVTELSRSFSPDAQSALIRFAQIAGKAKFNRSSQTSAMTQRQRRKREEYLHAFEQCCRFIPCWILTTSQISDYLPSEECLFDLVIVDEASQSDVTVLPGLLRGKQWLIVGDGKQVSPTESFISEETIDSLRSSLPESPLEASLLPGQSFFDLCSQAFPRGRVVLTEHFRCAEQIIAFSNHQFYHDRLIPLRLPTKSERLTPCLIDVKLSDGAKVGKVNVKEADKIVEMVRDITTAKSMFPRSIGIISLLGDEQSRLIRGRLLDVIGPEMISRHCILVGDPPTFQGAERDIIFLSMVCSKGLVPTQNQLMHAQRANVALSRARDRCVLVRSIDLTDIPSRDDVKVPIIEYFQATTNALIDTAHCWEKTVDPRKRGMSLMGELLVKEGFTVSVMGGVWREALCVEDSSYDTRVAILVDCDSESAQEWQQSYAQQKAIERVGWKCLRIAMLALVYDFTSTMQIVTKFLADAGVKSSIHFTIPIVGGAGMLEDVDEDTLDDELTEAEHMEVDEGNGPVGDNQAAVAVRDPVLIISDESVAASEADGSDSPDQVTSADTEAARFGQVVNLDFLLDTTTSKRKKESSSSSRKKIHSRPEPKRKQAPSDEHSSDSDSFDLSVREEDGSFKDDEDDAWRDSE
jgi:hypothetical protein